MASFPNRKSTAPPPPPLSQLWQMQNPSYPNSEADTHSVSTTHDLMDDEEINKILAKNGHIQQQHGMNMNNSDLSTHRKSITRQYKKPQPPLHATHEIINPQHDHNFDNIVKNNPYQNKKRITANHKKVKKRIIRPINAQHAHSQHAHNHNNNGYKHTITNMNHHRKESKAIDSFLRHRMPESELKKKSILPSNELQSNTDFWTEKQKQKEQLRSNLTRKLSKSFRPQQNELYDRGIYVTDPKEGSQYAAWSRADHRRQNSINLAKKFTKRPPPNEVLNRGIIRQDDYSELFNALPQTQPPTPTFPNTEENDEMDIGYNHDTNAIDLNHNNIAIDRSHINENQQQRQQKLIYKIKQRPTINEMKSRGLMYEDPHISASLQNRKRELHRRRASRKLEQFLQKRPNAETLRRRHIMISPQESNQQQKNKEKLGKHFKRRPSIDMLQKKHIFFSPDHTEVVYKDTDNDSNSIKRSSPNHRHSKSPQMKHQQKRRKKVWITNGKLSQSKRRESMTIHDFLLRRPNAEKLVKKHILPSMPYNGGYAEIQNDFRGDFKNKAKIIDKLYSNPHRFDSNELERRGYLPSEYVQANHDWETAKFQYTRRRKQSVHDLEKKLIHRPPMTQLINKAIIDPLSIKIYDQEKYHQRRKSQKLDFKNSLNEKFQARPEIDQVPYKYFIPNEHGEHDDNVKINEMIHNDSHETFESSSNNNNNLYSHINGHSNNNNNKANDDENSMNQQRQILDRQNSNPPPRPRGIKRKRVNSKTRESLVLEQFLPVRPEIQQLWDRNILPSLPPSPHKSAYSKRPNNVPSLFRFHTTSSDGINQISLSSPPAFKDIEDEEDIFKQNYTMQGIAQPISQHSKPSNIQHPNDTDTKENHLHHPDHHSSSSSPNPTQQTPYSSYAVHTNPTPTEPSHSSFSPITPQTMYIDKRRRRRQDSMAMLEERLMDRAPRESLFELGILIMSPAPSPPPLAVIQQTKQSLPEDMHNKNGVVSTSIYNDNATGIHGDIDTDDTKSDDISNIFMATQNNLEPSRKKRKLMNGEEIKDKYNKQNRKKTHKKKDSLVLTDFLGTDIAHKLDQHLWERPSPMELINRGIVPTYSFTKKFSNPQKFARHRRNMTMELQHRLENKLRSRPLLNDLPKKIYLVQENLKQLYDDKKISEMEQNEIDNLLSEMKSDHEKHLEEVKQRYWSMLIEQKDKYKQLEKVTTQNEITLRQKLETMSARCQSLSTELITKNTQLKEQDLEFTQRLNRLKLQHQQQIERQEKRLKLSDVTQRELREEIQKQQESDGVNLQQILENDKKYVLSQLDNNMYSDNNNSDNEIDLIALKHRISKIEENYQTELQRERTMHRKFNEQSERVKQTLVDEINKMERQHQEKLGNLENQIVNLKEKNRNLERRKQVEMNQLTQKLSSEIDKERNIATIMVEDLDEEKTRLIQEMESLKEEYESKLKMQKKQIDQLRQVAEEAVFYGNKAINNNNQHRDSVEFKNDDLQKQLEEKDAIITALQEKLFDNDLIVNKYQKLKQNKKKLEQQVLNLTQQILDTFKNNLNEDVVKKLNLSNGYQ